MELNDTDVKRLYEAGQHYLKPLEKILFNGSPSNLMNTASLTRREKQIAYITDRSVRVSFFNDSNRGIIYFYNLGFGEFVTDGKPTLAAYGSIEVIPAPNNKALVSVFYDYRFRRWRNHLERWWAQLRDGIESQGWEFTTNITDAGQSKTAVSTPTNQEVGDQFDQATLRKQLVGHFNKDELRNLCFDLEVDVEEISGDTKSAIARGLINDLKRQEHLEKLIELCRQKRPNASWDVRKS